MERRCRGAAALSAGVRSLGAAGWGQYGFAAARGNFNPYKIVLGRLAVAGRGRAWAGTAGTGCGGATLPASTPPRAPPRGGQRLLFERARAPERTRRDARWRTNR